MKRVIRKNDKLKQSILSNNFIQEKKNDSLHELILSINQNLI